MPVWAPVALIVVVMTACRVGSGTPWLAPSQQERAPNFELTTLDGE